MDGEADAREEVSARTENQTAPTKTKVEDARMKTQQSEFQHFAPASVITSRKKRVEGRRILQAAAAAALCCIFHAALLKLPLTASRLFKG